MALLIGVVGLVLQVLAWTHEGFGPADGGFASVYFGWTAFVFLFVLGTLALARDDPGHVFAVQQGRRRRTTAG